mmetsp:Transcript_13403/g.20333  ORF Transcript_13403/g.20333 Transcript_13403/m.20333 type:complete len:507 (+) Transcript_13403:362-1882(+)|eukprot:CAMPEP_0203676030 /NCGR_PEP_ID=MMETSP0090-20130426/22992_1 /ASSEMBLY_ACC=CAM_ASM_001088 /TAXON_ID=426623 /ORGANISM="Chaetoceros affinis, Strain CCMP159" /LENGTH=506 /DNA_ID=CAMNT_0050542423 /DNA_START=354 /DNA_END=1874 /DNA_ORIENTATION=-
MLERKRKLVTTAATAATAATSAVTTTTRMMSMPTPTPTPKTQQKSKEEICAFLPCHLKMLKALYDNEDNHNDNGDVKNDVSNGDGNGSVDKDEEQSTNNGIDNHGTKKNHQEANSCSSDHNNTATENPMNSKTQEKESIWEAIEFFLSNRTKASSDNQESAHLQGILQEASILISKYNTKGNDGTILIGGKKGIIINNVDGEPLRKKVKRSKNMDKARSNNNQNNNDNNKDDEEYNRVLFPKPPSFIALQSQQQQYQSQYQRQYQQQYHHQQTQMKSMLSPQIITTPSRHSTMSMYTRNHTMASIMSPPCSKTMYNPSHGNNNNSVNSITLLTKMLQKRLSSSNNKGKMKQLPFIPLLSRVKKMIGLLKEELMISTTGTMNNVINNNSDTGPTDRNDHFHGDNDNDIAETKATGANDSFSDDNDEDDDEIDVEGKYNQYFYLIQDEDGDGNESVNEDGSNLQSEYDDDGIRDSSPTKDQIATIKCKLILWKLLEVSLEAVVVTAKA